MKLLQFKGKKHIEYIRQLAKNIWKDTGYMEGQYIPSLKIAFKRHRAAMIASSKPEKDFTYPICIFCRKTLELHESYHYVNFCGKCWIEKRINKSAFQQN